MIHVRSHRKRHESRDLGSYRRDLLLNCNAAIRAAMEIREELCSMLHGTLLGYHLSTLVMADRRIVYKHTLRSASPTLRPSTRRRKTRGRSSPAELHRSPPMGGVQWQCGCRFAPAYSFSAYVAEVDGTSKRAL